MKILNMLFVVMGNCYLVPQRVKQERLIVVCYFKLVVAVLLDTCNGQRQIPSVCGWEAMDTWGYNQVVHLVLEQNQILY